LPPEEHRFKPGQSGNPNGRPKGAVSFLKILREKLNEELPDAATGERRKRAVRLVEAALSAAEDGDFRYFKEILDRFEGKVPDRMSLSVEDVAGTLERVAAAVLKVVPKESRDAVLEVFDRELGGVADSEGETDE